MTTRPTCVVYSRVSTSEQGQAKRLATAKGTVTMETSLDTQEAAAVALAEVRGWTVVGTYRDVYSGAHLWERPALAALRERVQAGGVDHVIAYAQDRLSRNMAHTAILVQEFSEAGAALTLVTENFEDSATGRFLAQARAFAGELERAKIVERTTRGRVARARAGGYLPGPKVRFGFRWADAAKTRMVADPVTSPTVERIFRWAADGTPLRGIAVRLNVEGLPPPSGGGHGWRHTTIRKMLIDPAYVGRAAAFRKQSVKVRSPRTGRRYVNGVLRPEGEQIAYPEGTVERLIDDETFEAANARLRRNKAEARRNNHNPEAALLRCGFARCGYCGRALAVNNRTGRAGQYTCKTNSDGTRTCPGTPSMDAGRLDAIVWRRVTETLTDPEVIAREVSRRTVDDDGCAREMARIDKLLNGLDARRRNLAANLGLLDPDSAGDVRAILATLADERKSLQVLREEVAGRVERYQADRERLVSIQAWCRRVGSNLDHLTYAEKRNALTALAAEARVWKTDHTPRYEITLRLSPVSDIVDTSGRARSTGSPRRGRSGDG